jgi:hypothetical protein
MPNVILTDEELQEVDQLLTEFDPERHPQTAPHLQALSDEDRKIVCTYVREVQRSILDLGIATRAVSIERKPQDSSHPETTWTPSRTAG